MLSPEELIGHALTYAERARPSGDVPIGAVLMNPAGELVTGGWNTREADRDPTGHAEINTLRSAAAITGSSRLDGWTLAVTVEPCTMCAGAISLARIRTLVFGCWEPKTGAVGSLWDVLRDRRLSHRVTVRAGVREQECAALLVDFFGALRAD